MNSPLFRTQECTHENCRFRFPLMDSHLDACPKCGAPLVDIGLPYARHTVVRVQHLPRSAETHVLLDNVRSLYNVGSVFRTAAAAGIQKVHLCGMSATPENPRLAKTALGAEEMLPWQYYNNGLDAAKTLLDDDFSLWAIEGGEHATPLFDATSPQKDQKIVLVIGNELAGIDPGILEVCERILYIPMQGHKESLNLTVAFGVAAYFLRFL